MILTFKTEINGKTTNFVRKIRAIVFKLDYKPKIHTIRKGYRFKAGHELHMTTNKRFEKKSYFNEGLLPLSKCISVQKIKIRHDDNNPYGYKMVWIERTPERFTYASSAEIERLAKNDGFDTVKDFWDFFKGKEVFEGQIIHWTDYRYLGTCQKCKKGAAQDKHPCPYLSDYEDDSNTLCNCCDHCANESQRTYKGEGFN